MNRALAERRAFHGNLLRGAIDALALWLGWMACAATLGMVALLTMEMVGRTAFNHSFAFAWEYVSYALGIAIFGGMAWTLRTGGHIRVAVLQSVLSAKAHGRVEWLAYFLGAVLATFLATAMVMLCASSFKDQTRSFLATETLLYIPQIFMALGAVGFALQAWLRLVLFQAGQPVDLKAARIESVHL